VIGREERAWGGHRRLQGERRPEVEPTMRHIRLAIRIKRKTREAPTQWKGVFFRSGRERRKSRKEKDGNFWTWTCGQGCHLVHR